MKKLIVIPTYNEKENIVSLIDQVTQLLPEVSILVVDDNSPDGTGDVVQAKIAQQKNDQKESVEEESETDFSKQKLFHLHRERKEGLGRAYIAGFKWGLDKGFDVISEMDADFSHRPKDLVNLLSAIDDSMFVVGSRYVPGGGTANWGLLRKAISRGGGLYSRFILGFPLRDWTGGFNIWRKEVLSSINLDTIKSEGYSFQIELKYRALKLGFQGLEVPILFEDRRIGQSKMSLKIVLEAFYRVWMIRFASKDFAS